ncbi:RNA-binding protein 44 isoform X1 [Arapaima gigas]
MEVTRDPVFIKAPLRQVPGFHSIQPMHAGPLIRPLFYTDSQCCNFRNSVCFDAERYVQHNIPTIKPQESFCPTDHGKELSLLPSFLKEELNLCHSTENIRDPPVQPWRQYHAVGCAVRPHPAFDPKFNHSVKSFCNRKHFAEVPQIRQGTQGSRGVLAPELWEVAQKSTSVTVFKDPVAETSFSKDVELQMHGKTSDLIWGNTKKKTTHFSEVQREAFSKFCNFNSPQVDCVYTESNEKRRLVAYDYSKSEMENSNVQTVDSSCVYSDKNVCSHSECKENKSRDGYLAKVDQTCEPNEKYHVNKKEPVAEGFGGTKSCLLALHQQEDHAKDFQDMILLHSEGNIHQRVVTVSKSITDSWKTKQDIAVNTDATLQCCSSQDQEIQTLSASTAEKSAITDLHMSDLNYIAEEFTKLKLEQAELKKLKDNLKSSADTEHSSSHERGLKCDCDHGTLWAQIRLLALQLKMCQQHCLSTEPQSETLEGILQKLKDDFEEINNKITHNLLEDKLQSSTGQKSSQLTGCSDCHGRTSACLQRQEVNKADAVAELFGGWQSGGIGNTIINTETEKEHKSRLTKDIESSETWYDAEEELQDFCGAVNATVHKNYGTFLKKVFCSGRKDNGNLLSTSLPNDVTEEEVSVLFGKHEVSNINIATFSNNFSVANVTVCPSSADTAVEELNGHCFRGHATKVEHVCRPNSAKNSMQVQWTKVQPFAFQRGESECHSPPLTVTKPFRYSVEKLLNVQESPTSLGVFVPKHSGTASSFDNLISLLLKCHPEEHQEIILDALLELQATQEGFLSELPVQTIVKMTSNILQRSRKQDPSI